MNFFRIPKSVSKDIDTINRNFFWLDKCDPNAKNSTIHTIYWDKICRPKCERRLGILKTEDVNAVFLAKQG